MVSRRAELNKDLLDHTFEITSPTGECASKVTFSLRFSLKTNETTVQKYSKTIANSTININFSPRGRHCTLLPGSARPKLRDYLSKREQTSTLWIAISVLPYTTPSKAIKLLCQFSLRLGAR